MIAAIQVEESPDVLLETLRRTRAEIESSDADPGVRFDREKRVEHFVCYRLAELGTDDALAALAGLLTSDSSSLREAACHRIGTFPNETAVPLPAQEQVVADPERTAGSGRRLPCIEVGLMCPLETADIVVVAAEHVRGAREELEIVRAKRRGPMGARQRLERRFPRALGVGLATSIEFGARIHRGDYRAPVLSLVDYPYAEPPGPAAQRPLHVRVPLA